MFNQFMLYSMQSAKDLLMDETERIFSTLERCTTFEAAQEYILSFFEDISSLGTVTKEYSSMNKKIVCIYKESGFIEITLFYKDEFDKGFRFVKGLSN